MDKTQALIAEYAGILGEVYEGKTAGDYTFIGILAEFVSKLGEIPIIPPHKVDTLTSIVSNAMLFKRNPDNVTHDIIKLFTSQ